MPSVRFSRDKRGYEYVYLVHTPTRRGKPGRTARALLVSERRLASGSGDAHSTKRSSARSKRRTPASTFDWEAIINTPMPPPDMTEYWRERRRAEKAARQERRAAEAEELRPADRGERGQRRRRHRDRVDAESDAANWQPRSRSTVDPQPASTPDECRSKRRRLRRKSSEASPTPRWPSQRGRRPETAGQETAVGRGAPDSVETPTKPADPNGQSDEDESASEEQ